MDNIKITMNLKKGWHGLFLVRRRNNRPFFASRFFCYAVKNPLNSSFRYHTEKGEGEYRIPLDEIEEIEVLSLKED